jgi:fatty acid desaturase
MEVNVKRPSGGNEALVSTDELRRWQHRSDGRGLLRLAGHLAAVAVTAAAYGLAIGQRGRHPALIALTCLAYGFTLVTMFAAMHESVHRTAFKTPWLNNAVGWFAGLLSFYNSTFYRHYHGWHHRFTQLPGRDPELEDPKPTGYLSYALELTGIPWWLGKLRRHVAIALGRVGGHGFLNDRTRPEVIRSVRLQLLVYGVGIAGSIAVGRPLILTFWLLPVAAAQPLLRAILLAEHTACSNDDDAMANTRTTHTSFPVRFLMWEMPFHAEHHRYPALPFFALRRANVVVGPHLVHVARKGYVGFHLDLLAGYGKAAAAKAAARMRHDS